MSGVSDARNVHVKNSISRSVKHVRRAYFGHVEPHCTPFSCTLHSNQLTIWPIEEEKKPDAHKKKHCAVWLVLRLEDLALSATMLLGLLVTFRVLPYITINNKNYCRK